MKRLLILGMLSVLIFMDKALSSNETCPTTGTATTKQYVNSTVTLKILLVEFSDVKHRTSPVAYTKTDFENLLVSNGIYVSPNMYSPDVEGVYGSLNDYYRKMSNGNLTITGYVVNTVGGNNIPNWVTLPNTKNYYGSNGIFSDAVSAATSQGLNVSGLGDYVKLVIIYAGNIHFNDDLNPQSNGIPGTIYIMSERNGTPWNSENGTDAFGRVGTHCHEFGHLIGISHTEASRADIMDAGRRNGPVLNGSNGSAPAPLNPIARWKKGWLNPTFISNDTQCNAYYSLTVPQVFVINSNANGDYFLIENRRFDQNMVIGSTSVPDYNNAAWMPIAWTQNATSTSIQEGILAWRVRGGMTLEYNSNGLIYASGRYGASYPDNHPSETDAGDVFPGTAGTTILSPYSDSRDPYQDEGSPDHYTLYVPNTKGGTNVGMEVLSENTAGGYFTIRLHSAQQVLPATISSSQTLSGEYICTSNVTINSGVTVNISAGSTLVFQSGTSLYNNGVLNVNGTSSQPVISTSQKGNSQNSWGSIVLSGSGASGSNLNYITMLYGTDIQFLNGANGTLQNSLVKNCSRGVYVYNSNANISSNSFQDNINEAIFCNASGYTHQIHVNTITKTSGNPQYHQQWAIDVSGTSYGYMSRNDISGFNYGMYIGGGATAYFLKNQNLPYTYPNNRIRNCNYAVTAAWGGSVRNNAYYYMWYSSIYNNVYYDLYAYSSGTIYSMYDYYGGGNPKSYKDNGNSTINVQYPLANNPWGGLLRSQSADNSAIIQTSAGNNDDVDDGITFEQQKNYIGAIEYYQGLLKNGKVSQKTLAALAHFGAEAESKDVTNYYETLKITKNEYQPFVMELLAGLYTRQGDSQKSAAIYDEIIKAFPNTYYEKLSWFQKFYYALHIEQNKVKALNLLSAIKSKYSNDDAEGYIEQAESMLGSAGGLKKKGAEEQLEPLSTHELLQNYPNPFNPITVISYQLQNDAKVTLKVFDILGREVVTLVDGEIGAGNHTAMFDGSKLSSGIYFTRMIVQSQDGQPIVQVKKMLLMK